jgi:protocatechuate 3,4-dioxygenase beta subunit
VPLSRPRTIAIVVSGVALVGLVVLLVVLRQRSLHPLAVPAWPAMPASPAHDPPIRPTPPPAAGIEILTGRVVDGTGAPVAGIDVEATPEHGGFHRSGASAADGKFEIDGLAPGPVRIRVEGAPIVAAEVRHVEVPGAAVEIVVVRRVTVEGLVSDQGLPVVGATVSIDGPSLASTREVTSAAGGRFLIDDLPEGDYVLTVHKGRRAATDQASRFGTGPWPEVSLALGPAAEVVGTVSADKKPLAGAHVVLTPERGPARVVESDADGHYAFEGVLPGAWTVDALAPGMVPPGMLHIDVVADTTIKLDIPLVLGLVAEVKVHDADGDPIEGATVALEWTGAAGAGADITIAGRARRWARALGRLPSFGAGHGPDFLPLGELGVTLGPVPFAPPPGARLAESPVAEHEARPAADPGEAAMARAQAGLITDASGLAHIDGVPAGSWTVRASHPDFAEGTVKARFSAARLRIEVVLARGTVIEGHIVGIDGNMVSGARVRADCGDDRRCGSTGTTDDTGAYRLERVSGKVHLVADDLQGNRAQLDLDLRPADEGGTITRDLTLAPGGGRNTGKVLDPRGRPVAGAHLVLAGATAISDERGAFVIASASGPSELVVQHPDWPTTRLPAVPPGKADLVIHLPAGGGIEGLVRDGQTRERIPGAEILARLPPAGEVHATADASGQFDLEAMAAGSWTLTVRAAGYARTVTKVEVAARAEPRAHTVRDYKVELLRGARLGGVVYDEHGQPVAAASVECRGVRATTDVDGKWVLAEVPTGDNLVTARFGGRRGQKKVALRPGEDQRGLELRLGE